MTFRMGIIGCGVIGERRASHLPNGAQIAAVFDPNEERARALAVKHGARPYQTLASFLSENLDGVIVAASNDALVSTAGACLERGLPVLVEKPAARSVGELQALQNPGRKLVKIGFNHRFHPAFKDLLAELAARPDDPVMYVRGRYGNGARVGFDREWRSSVAHAGGGELLDQGVHLLDLASLVIANLEVKASWVRTHYWDMPVDDNAWAILSSPAGQTFAMHVSSTEWKNEFSFEVYTRKRKYAWNGLGRSYGPETLTIYQMKPEMGPPDVSVREYPGPDQSWLLENTNFVDAVRDRGQAWGTYADAVQVLALVKHIYEISAKAAHTQTHPQWWKDS